MINFMGAGFLIAILVYLIIKIWETGQFYTLVGVLLGGAIGGVIGGFGGFLLFSVIGYLSGRYLYNEFGYKHSKAMSEALKITGISVGIFCFLVIVIFLWR